MFRNKIFIIIFLFCFTSLSAGPLRFPEKFDPVDRFGLSAEYVPSLKTRTVDSLNCELIGGWFRGPSFAVCVVGSFAYIGAGQSMKILNVKDSTNPVLIGEVLLPSFYISDISVKDTLAYVTDFEEGLRVINASDPSSPIEVGFCNTPGRAMALWVQDTFAYIADANFSGFDDRGLRIIDISDPSSPIMIGSYSEPWYYNCYDVCVQDTIAYVASGDLRIISVSDPSSPYDISVFNDTVYNPPYFSRVYVRDTLVYAASWDYDNGSLHMSIINVVDLSLPFEVGSYDLSITFPYNIGDIGDICVQDSLAYIAVLSQAGYPELDSCGLYIINVSDPTAMNEVGNYLTGSGRAQDVWVKDNIAYVSCCAGFSGDPEGLIIIDVSNPSFPSEVGKYDTYSWIDGVWVKDSFAYVSNSGRGLNIINVSDPSAPFEVGFCNTQSNYGPYGVYVQDTFAYVAEGDSGLCIINVSNPSAPTEIGFYNIPGGVEVVWVQDTLAYLAADSLCIINVSDPSSPTEIGFYNTPGWVGDVWVRDTLAYLAAGGLRIINVSDPSLPTEVGSIPPGGFEKIFIKDTLAYVIDGSLRIIDISDPSSPVEVGFYNLPGEGWLEDVWVKDNLAYVARDTSGLRIIDVSDPSSPTEVGFYNIYWGGYPNASDVYVQDSLIYLTFRRAGLYILKYTGTVGGIEEISIENDGFNAISISSTIGIKYSVIAEKEKVKIEIFNILGQKVGCPVDGIRARGNYTLNWNGKTGIYFVRMEMGGKIYRQKVLLIR